MNGGEWCVGGRIYLLSRSLLSRRDIISRSTIPLFIIITPRIFSADLKPSLILPLSLSLWSHSQGSYVNCRLHSLVKPGDLQACCLVFFSCDAARSYVNGAAPRSCEIVSTSYDADNGDRSVARRYLDRRRTRLHFILYRIIRLGSFSTDIKIYNLFSALVPQNRYSMNFLNWMMLFACLTNHFGEKL